MGNMSCSGQGFQYAPKYFGTLVDQFYLVIDRDVHQRALTYDYQSSTECNMDVGIAINTNIADASL